MSLTPDFNQERERPNFEMVGPTWLRFLEKTTDLTDIRQIGTGSVKIRFDPYKSVVSPSFSNRKMLRLLTAIPKDTDIIHLVSKQCNKPPPQFVYCRRSVIPWRYPSIEPDRRARHDEQLRGRGWIL